MSKSEQLVTVDDFNCLAMTLESEWAMKKVVRKIKESSFERGFEVFKEYHSVVQNIPIVPGCYGQLKLEDQLLRQYEEMKSIAVTLLIRLDF